MDKTRTTVSLLAVLCVCAMALAAQAAPSLQGYTGLVLTPNADSLGEKDFNVAFYTLDVENGDDSDVWAANLGVDEGLEVGFARVKPDQAESETFLNAKYQMQRETMERPALAVGVIDLTDEVDTTTYVVMSKNIPPFVKSRKGIFNTRIHAGISGGQLSGVFAGVSLGLGSKLTLLGEYDTDDVNFGARLAVGHGVRLHGAWLNDFDDVALGASYNKSF